MKTFAVILLIACLSLPFTGSYIFIHVKKNQLKKEIHEFILKEPVRKDLIILKFTEEETRTKLDWKHDGEFRFNGHMYDIVEKSCEGGIYIFTCYRDHKETRLIEEEKELMAKALSQDPVNKDQIKQIKSYFSSIFSKDAFTWKPDVHSGHLFLYISLVFRFTPINLTPLVPPPR